MCYAPNIISHQGEPFPGAHLKRENNTVLKKEIEEKMFYLQHIDARIKNRVHTTRTFTYASLHTARTFANVYICIGKLRYPYVTLDMSLYFIEDRCACSCTISFPKPSLLKEELAATRPVALSTHCFAISSADRFKTTVLSLGRAVPSTATN